ncbi:ERO1-like protein alpha [Enteropsectra breve]|nr:ERO1-like protein alpha [Enteropsectra breve]
MRHLISLVANCVLQNQICCWNNNYITRKARDYCSGLTELEQFSKIKLAFSGKCHRNTEKCKEEGCTIKKTVLANGENRIDLLKNPESFSPHGRGGPEVWRDIYALIETNNAAKTIVSGLQFSINTHIAMRYSKWCSFYITNPSIFQRRYKKEYEMNFHLLYTFVCNAITKINENPTDIDSSVHKLSDMVSQSKSQFSTKGEEINSKMDIQIINTMLLYLNCLSCEKCLLWGTIQLRGLRASLKLYKRIPITELDATCLVNLFERLNFTMDNYQSLLHASRARCAALWIYYNCYSILGIGLLCFFAGTFYTKMRSARHQNIEFLVKQK